MTILLAMAGLGMQFNANQHAERTMDALPAGYYVAQIVNSEVKPTKTPGGARLNLQFKILQGDFAGRVTFGGYNVQNANPVTVNIAMEELAELSRAVGVPVWNDTQQLHGIPFNLKLKVVPPQNGYDEKNEPAQYKHISDMANVRYATKADIKQGAAPVGQAFGAQTAPQQNQPQQTNQQPQQPQGWGNNTQQQPAQTQQQPVQQPVQQQTQPQQPVQQPAQQEPQQGAVNFNQAAQSQPWGQNTQQQPAEQQPQQTAQQQVQQEQPVQQQQAQPQTQQQPQQPLEGEHIPANNGGQPSWATQKVQPGTEQPVQQNNAQKPVEQPDDIQQAAQSQTPPWKQQAQ